MGILLNTNLQCGKIRVWSLKQQGYSYWIKLKYVRTVHTVSDRRVWYFGMLCWSRSQRSVVKCTDFCDLKKRLKHYWWFVRSTCAHILHAVMVILLMLQFPVGNRNLSMFRVWIWAHSCNSVSFPLLSVMYVQDILQNNSKLWPLLLCLSGTVVVGCCLP